MMTELTSERARELLSYNPLTGELTWIAKTSGRRKQGGIAGSKMKIGYLEIGIDNKRYLIHRVVWLIVYGHWPADQIDHINGIRDDNRISNLREASNIINGENKMRARVDSKTKMLGASWSTYNKKYVSQIVAKGKHYFLGHYTTPEAAHDAYLTAKRQLHDGCTI